MLLKELIRFSTQHRTLYCYLILSIWIFLLIAGMYKYIGNSNSIGQLVFLNGRRGVYATTIEDEENVKFRKYKQRCTPLESLGRKDDGGILDGWKLQGVLMVIRHGDRGPMSHVRGVSYISCGVHGDSLLNRYRSFLYNTTTSNSQSQSAGTNHMFWNKLGPFHGFALLPSHEKSCLLGQLTYKGIAQLLHVGEILHQIYAHPLGLLLRPPHSKHYASSSTPHSLLNSDEVVLYSTRYRRTFQSAMALLFPFLPQDKWLALNVRESHSMAFCFSDCACSRAETLRRKLNAMNGNHLLQHPAVSAIVQWIGSILLQQTATNGMNDPNEVADAVLTVLCHDAPLPCRQITKSSNYTKIATTPQEQQRQQMAAETQAVDFNDVINIDQDDVVAIAQPSNMLDTPPSNAFRSGTVVGGDEMQMMGGGGACIEPNHIAALISYTNWESSMEANHSFYKRIGLMRAYGMIRHIVSYMLKMISGDRTKFVLYSGHDWTMQYLTAALGIQTETTFIPYATRLAIEVYKSEMHTDYYFRVVYNGRDVTQQIDFCEGGKSLRVTRDSRGNKADLCPIENIIRFLHEDYFAPLNATNFKDACANFQRTNSNDFF